MEEEGRCLRKKIEWIIRWTQNDKDLLIVSIIIEKIFSQYLNLNPYNSKVLNDKNNYYEILCHIYVNYEKNKYNFDIILEEAVLIEKEFCKVVFKKDKDIQIEVAKYNIIQELSKPLTTQYRQKQDYTFRTDEDF